ncbi:hypothetical protein FMUND_7241 [Fusarium mundagurra]|uniref:Reverse transcriptase domain-containing protein n=1 Tax=Fusarium mundagurra TaxID=1567541 RepID=A0A8H5YLJ2_9HYPO|nr:hypothetical protein FMUND_7241 [Fusarium mundagurra]
MNASTLPIFPAPADVEMSLDDDDEQDSPHQDYRELLNDERCVNLLDQGACHDHPDNNTPDNLLIWQANIKRCDTRAFHGIPGYHVWYLSDGQFTEEDYDPDAQHRKWAKIVDKCLEALDRAQVAINVSQPWLPPTSITTQQANPRLASAHEALSSLHDIAFTNEDTATIAKSTLLCVSNTLSSVQTMVTEVLAACSAAPSELISAKKAFSSVQKSIYTGVNSLSDKSFQFKAAPKMHSVGFYVHNSIPTTSWRVKTCKGANRELLATLEIATATKPLAIHNVYNHLNKLKVEPLLSYLDSCSSHSILLGDFNYHHKDWNGNQRTETSTSGNNDTSKRSSTIDLTFAKESVSDSVGYCEVLQVPGFESDHRVIETSVKRTVKTEAKTMPCWHKVTPAKFQHHLKPRLPPLDSSLDNEDQVVSFFAKIIDALHVTMTENVPRRVGRSQPLQFAQTLTLEYKGDSEDGNETQFAVSDDEKVEMIKKVKFRNNNNPESKRILDEPGPRHDPQREDINMPRSIDAEKLRKIIKGLKNNKAPGPDKVPNEAIKLGMELLLPYFDSIIVMLLKTGKEPDKPESYRPISLLSTVGKLYERILTDMMLDVLKEHPHLLPATQFGNKTTTEALQYLFRIIYSTWCSNSDDVVTILGLDMSSAYDNVYRQKLLQILYDKGFPRWFVDIIGLVLSQRDATLRLPGIVSKLFELNTGIPQGSPLSTILFYFFVCPLVEQTFPPRRIYVDGRKETVRLYQFSFVDDVYYIAVSRSYAINCRGLEILHEQMLPIAKELFISFGSHKYHVMHMRPPTVRQPTHNQVRPVIKGFVEKVQEKMTILGVIVDSQMTFDLHVTEITRKCRQRLGYMKRISGSTWGPDMYAIRQYYLTLIRPVITYACGAWFIKQREGVSTPLHFGLNKKVIGRLQSLQSECLRFVSGAYGCVAGTLLEKELFIENMWSILHSQATLQRAMSFTSHDSRWRSLCCGDGSSKARIKNPIIPLEEEAGEMLKGAVEYQMLLAQDSDDPSHVQAMADRFADRKGRGKIVGSHIKWLATQDCQHLWQEYVKGRKATQLAAGKHPSRLRLPVALDESWGRESRGYYKGMTRAQSTMLFQCRTEFIGLKYHLFRIKLGDAPSCRCEKSRGTPFHLFVECSKLDSNRKRLFRELQHNNFSTLLTVDGRVAAEWAIRYFDIEQFDNVRKKSSIFPLDPSCISPREERISTTNSLQSTLSGQTMVSYATGITLLDSARGTSLSPRRAVPISCYGVPAGFGTRQPQLPFVSFTWFFPLGPSPSFGYSELVAPLITLASLAHWSLNFMATAPPVRSMALPVISAIAGLLDRLHPCRSFTLPLVNLDTDGFKQKLYLTENLVPDYDRISSRLIPPDRQTFPPNATSPSNFFLSQLFKQQSHLSPTDSSSVNLWIRNPSICRLPQAHHRVRPSRIIPRHLRPFSDVVIRQFLDHLAIFLLDLMGRSCRRDVAVVAKFDDLQEGLIVMAVLPDSRIEPLELLRLAQLLACFIVDNREEVWSWGCDLRAWPVAD